MHSQSIVTNQGWFQAFFQAKHFSAILALSFSLILSACGGGGSTVTENDLVDPGSDGVTPTLTSVSILQQQEKNSSPDGVAKLGQSIKVDFTASEALMTPEVTINGVAASLEGKIGDWSASRAMTADDVDGYVTFNISFEDTSGEVGVDVSETTDGSRVQYCAEGCVAPVEDPLVGDWMLDGAGAAGVGPTPGSMEWWSADAAAVEARACWFDDVFSFTKAGSFSNVLGEETWLETWQGAEAEGCGAPVAPHDGSADATWAWDEAAGTLTINGKGAHLGLAKAVNGQELSDPGAAPDSITYQILTLTADGMNLTVTVETGAGVWWTFNLAKKPVSPFVGAWKLDGAGAAGVGPVAGSMEWWSADEAAVTARACWFDDSFVFGTDGSFSNQLGSETWLETWQGADAEGCGVPVAPHDGSAVATFSHDEAAGTLTINGKGAHLGLAKAVNGQELSDPGATPDSITYQILTLTADGMNLTVTVETGAGVWWTFNLAKVPPSPLAGNWRLDGAGSAGVGPVAGSMEWWSADDAAVAARACWFDDRFTFGDDGSFTNVMGSETWLETWQGAEAESCGTPVAPHNGSAAATFSHDQAAGTLTINGKGAHLGLAKAVNGQELSDPGAAPDSITYQILTLTADGMNLTVTVETGAGVWWTFNLVKVPVSALAGSWSLDGAGSAGVGPTEGSMEWWSADAAAVEARACWFDDSFVFGDDGSFSNVMGSETWLETWQGAEAESCGTPVAPHDGSAVATYSYDEAAGTITINGKGAHLGLPKAVNGQELSDPGAAPDSITYKVLTATSDGKYVTVTLETGAGVWWTFNLAKNDSAAPVDPVDPVDPDTTTLGGKVIDGYVSGATVFLDLNFNGLQESNEPSAISVEEGQFSFDLSASDLECASYVPTVVDVPVGAVDADLGVVEQAYQMILPPRFEPLNSDNLLNVSPLASAVWEAVESQLAGQIGELSCTSVIANEHIKEQLVVVLASSIADVVQHYNIPEAQLFEDFVASGNTAVQASAVKIVKGLKKSLVATAELQSEFPSATWAKVNYYFFSRLDAGDLYPDAWYRDMELYNGDFIIKQLTKVSDDLATEIRPILFEETAVSTIDGVSLRLERGFESRNGDDSDYSCNGKEELSTTLSDVEYQLVNITSRTDIESVEDCQIGDFAESTESRYVFIRDMSETSESGAQFTFQKEGTRFSSLT